MDPTVFRIKHSNLQREKCFSRNNYFSDHHSFLWHTISLSFFVHLSIISAICYFLFYQLIGWEHFLVRCCCSKKKTSRCIIWAYLNSSRYFQVNFLNIWLQIRIHLIFHERGLLFPVIYGCWKWSKLVWSKFVLFYWNFTIH